MSEQELQVQPLKPNKDFILPEEWGRMPVRVSDKEHENAFITPSYKECFVAEMFVKTGNFKNTLEAYKQRFGKEMSPQTLGRWLNKVWVKRYIDKLLTRTAIYNEWRLKGKEGFLVEWIQRLEDGKKHETSETYILRQIGEILGYYEGNSHGGNQQAVVINFKQADGRD